MCERVVQTCEMLGERSLEASIVNVLRQYVMINDVNRELLADQRVMMAFYLLKPEVDKAKARSKRAREAAARRKEMKQTDTTLQTASPSISGYQPDYQPEDQHELTAEEKRFAREVDRYIQRIRSW